MNESTLDKKIKAWEDHLLDLGKRNKMICFRESRRATLKILKPGFEELYRQIVVEERELSFQKAIERDTDPRMYAVLSLMEKLSCPMEVAIGDIRAAGSLAETKKTLRHLRAKARLAIDEQGTNILYLVFGFIEWREKGSHADSWLRSPLLLVPVTLSLPALNRPYYLKRHEDEIVVNPTLAYLFERDYGIKMPEFDPEKETLEGFLQKMEQLVEPRGWQIVRECSMGLVSFLKISMYNDLVRNEAQLKENPIIRAFAGERNAVNMVDGDTYTFDHDAKSWSDSFQVLSADSSQQDALALARQGVSFVMQGPPGTGKSQTITNMIAQALADGKKVLFVSEKMAALDVVYRRLTDVQLADFCLPLHSYKANKKEILQQLGKNLELRRLRVRDEEMSRLARLDLLRQQLKGYVEDIHQTIQPLDMSPYEVYGAIAQLADLPDILVRLEGTESLSKTDIQQLSLLISDYDAARAALGDGWKDNPWQGYQLPYPEVSQKRLMQEDLRRVVDVLSALEACCSGEDSLAQMLTADTLDTFLELVTHAFACSEVPHAWFYDPIEQEERTVRQLLERNQIAQQQKQALQEKYAPEFFRLQGQETFVRFLSLMKSYRNVLQPGKNDREAFLLMQQDLQQTNDLQEACRQLRQAIEEFSQKYQLPLPMEYGSLAVITEICELLLQQQPLTPWYFGAENAAQRSSYLTQLQKQWAELETQKQALCRRYSEELLHCPEARHLLSRLQEAEAKLSALVGTDAVHADLCVMDTLDPAAVQEIADSLCDPALEAAQAQFRLPIPKDLKTVQLQLDALEKIRHCRLLPDYRCADTRKKAKRLLKTAAERSAATETALEQLRQYYLAAGIPWDEAQICREQIQLLQQAATPIPHASYLLPACGNEQTDAVLTALEQQNARLTSLLQQLQEKCGQWGIAEPWDAQLLACRMQAFRDAPIPCPAWSRHRTEATALLTQLQTLANRLKDQRSRLLQAHEPSVLELDHVGMLQRFKTEYTGFLRIFRSSYREDVRQVRLTFRQVQWDLSDEDIIALLQTLKQYHDDLAKFHALAPEAARLLEIRDLDIWTDLAAVQQRLEDFGQVCKSFRNDESAYAFLAGTHRQALSALLSDIQQLEAWFDDHAAAKQLFGPLYNGAATDTTRIRQLMQHCRQMCAVFASPEQYLSVLDDPQACAAAAEHGNTILKNREWFASKAQQLQELAGADRHENYQTQLAHLENHHQLAETFGEDTAYALIDRYQADEAALQAHLDALRRLDSIGQCARSIGITARKKKPETIPLEQLLEEIRHILSGAEELRQVYLDLAVQCPQLQEAPTGQQLRKDLEDIVRYQTLHSQLFSRDAEIREKLGPLYTGETTHWESIRGNLELNDRLTKLLRRTPTPELIQAFVDTVPLFSRVKLSVLQGQLSTAKRLENAYPAIARSKDLACKQQLLAEAIAALEALTDLRSTISAAAYGTCEYEDMLEDLQLLEQYQQTQADLQRSMEQAKQLLPTFCLDENTQWDQLAEIFGHVKHLRRAIGTGKVTSEMERFLTNGIPGLQAGTCRSQLGALVEESTRIRRIVDAFDAHAALGAMDLSALACRLRDCLAHFASLDNMIDLRECKKACAQKGMDEFIAMAEDTDFIPGTLQDIFLKGFYYTWFEKVCAGIDSIANFRVRTQESRVNDFRELDAHRIPVDQMRIRQLLIQEMPGKQHTGRGSDEISVLLRELDKKRNIMPLRRLFREIPNLLLRLKPCLMMSPLSVAYFLEAETYRFDMVIFDEASQIFPQDAIGAIFRAKQVIITGDSKQLPPTNFFAASTSNDADVDMDEEDWDSAIFDSILEEAANNLPNRSLLWHYRSRFEELISFSNRQIYQNHLITFPSSTIHIPDTGVEYVYVSDGVYENRCNRAEARRIVELIAEHVQKYPQRSLGVIAFSESQQSMIEDELNQFLLRNPLLEPFFAEDKEEPFFIKNLENVQGDERDTILFSVCYAKNPQGKMYMRFGPLGHQGGERRLNVAITRAKQNIKLVGSILPEDIDLSKTESEGVAMLRSYISFAMGRSRISNAPAEKTGLMGEDLFCRQVANFLISRGCSVRTHVGSSDYTVDIAVEHPQRPGHYIAGIECDGHAYRLARSVRDREHLRPAVLEQMGWKMYRVWSTEWIRNPEAEQLRLLDFIRDALMHYGQTVAPIVDAEEDTPAVETESVTEQAADTHTDPENPYGIEPYAEGNWRRVDHYRARDRLSILADRIRAVVAVEQPIHMDLLYRRMADAFGVTKVSPNVRHGVDEAIRSRMASELVINDQFVQLRELQLVTPRRSPIGAPHRAIEQIAISEITAAMVRILSGAYGMEQNVLHNEVARVFGFERAGNKIRQRTNEALQQLTQTGRITNFDGKIQLLEE